MSRTLLAKKRSLFIGVYLPPNSQVITPDAPIACVSRFFFEAYLEMASCGVLVNSGVRVEVSSLLLRDQSEDWAATDHSHFAGTHLSSARGRFGLSGKAPSFPFPRATTFRTL